MKSIRPQGTFAMLTAWAALGASSLCAQYAGAGPSGSVVDDLETQVRMSRAPHSGQTQASGGRVSVDILRHPLKEKARRMLLRALEATNAGDHESAIAQLKETLDKYPDSALYVHSFLGVEYLKTDQFQDAVNSFEQAASFLPHDPITHYNFAISLACAGDYARAEEETRRSLELNPDLKEAHELLGLLEQRAAELNPATSAVVTKP